MSSEDLTGIEWRFSEWLAMNGGVNPDNVMEYFSLSPFWDPNSNNATLKMQTNFNALEGDGLRLKYIGFLSQVLKIYDRNMVGIEFELVKEQYPALFIIQKQRRKSPTEAFPIAIYYIVNGNIYQSPNLYSILANRMLTIVSHLNRAFRDVYKFVQFHPSSGYRYKVNLEKSEEEYKPVDNESAMFLREFQTSVDRVFINEVNLKQASKQTTIPTEHPTMMKLISTKEALSQVTVDIEKNPPANTSVSTPSSIDGGKVKRKSDKDGSKKKKKVKTEAAAS